MDKLPLRDSAELQKRAGAEAPLYIVPRSFDINKKPRRCRVLQSFEPAFAGGPLNRNSALARAYRVIPERWKPLKRVLAQNVGSSITNTAGQFPYTMIHKHKGRESLIDGFLKVHRFLMPENAPTECQEFPLRLHGLYATLHLTTLRFCNRRGANGHSLGN